MTMPELPAGFRFHPTDEELIVHYLANQAAARPCPVPIVAEVNIYRCDPWDLPAKAAPAPAPASGGDNNGEWYFFSPRDRKYPNGARPNRAAGSGYWKATGTDKPILSSSAAIGENVVGVKKALVFYSGRPPRGVKTDWIMHEYRLTPTAAPAAGAGNTTTTTTTNRSSTGGSSTSISMRLDDWVLCRIHKKSNDFHSGGGDQEQEQEGSSVVEDGSSPKSTEALDQDHQLRQAMTKSCSLTDLLNTIDCAALSQMLLLDAPPAADDEPPLIYYPATTTSHNTFQQTFNYNNNSNGSSHFISSNLAPSRADSSGSDNSGLRKRTMMLATDGAAAGGPFFDDGSGSSAFSSKKLRLLPSDSRSGRHHHHSHVHLVGNGNSSGASSYCNHLVVDTHTTTGGFQFHQPSSLMTMSYPFLEMQ